MNSTSVETVGVLTASSNSGAACVEALLSKYKHTNIRAIFRSETKASALREAAGARSNLEIITGVDANSRTTLTRALEGCSVAFLVTPHDPTRGIGDDGRLVNNMIQAAVDVGVRHVIYCGSWTVNKPDELSELAGRFLGGEALLRRLGEAGKITWTVLRGGFFYTNFHQILASLKKSDEFTFVQCCVPANDPKDIGRVAATVAGAGGKGFEGQVFEISGPQRLWMGDVAQVFGKVLGREVQFVDGGSEFLQGMPSFLKQAFGYLREAGEEAVPISNDVETVTGQPAVSLLEWVAENQKAFRREE